jgi:YHS domain-containing protein
MIYRKFYGAKLTFKLVGIFWAVMSLSGLATQKIFSAVNLTPSHLGLIPHASRIGNNLTSWLDLLAILISGLVLWLYLTRIKSDTSSYAKDPICGMQVEKSTAAASYNHDGTTFYFCAPGCLETFKNSVLT